MTAPNAFLRKFRQLASDPVLRRWLAGRAVGRWPGEPSYTAHRPPYLSEPGVLPSEPGTMDFAELPTAMPTSPLTLSLAGHEIRLEPGDENNVFDRRFDDQEIYLALHRFAWLPIIDEGFTPAWLGALWKAWRDSHGEPYDGWSWHPYTASERLVNMIRYGRRHGLPAPLADTLAILGRHGPVILARLEYFGAQYTGNHLANDGRGLFLGGLALDIPEWADIGGRILTAEAERIFSPSGILREGSSHYHLLLTRSYAECWLAARAAGRPDTHDLEAITEKALSVIPALSLPGGFPLVGDISPDCPPEHLLGLLDTSLDVGWIGRLEPADRLALRQLMSGVVPDDPHADGWLRADIQGWAGLWHAAPHGWSTMPGHGHQDCGSFEMHFDGEAVFVDPGRGAYGENGEAVRYCSAAVHNSLIVDDDNPYAANRPYYDDTFRRLVGGEAPVLSLQDDVITLCHSGFGRLRGGGKICRKWLPGPNGLDIVDRVEGRGRHRVRRHLVTPHAVTEENDGVLITGDKNSYRIRADTAPSVSAMMAWRAYGQGLPATSICFDVNARLPWEGRINVTIA